jgi:hypothetical protein
MSQTSHYGWFRVAARSAVAALLLVGLVGCKGDTGPAGPSGVENCTTACHTDSYTMEDYIVALQTEYEESQHFKAETFLRRGSTSSPQCAGCHSTEGYQHYAETGTAIAVTESSPIGCFACHAPHTKKNFSQRKTGPTTLEVGGTYDKGPSNTCAMCHQLRAPSPTFTSADTIKSSRWGPHHAGQANILTGIGAYVFAGRTYPTGPSHNSLAKGCVACHMASLATDNLAGGHTFKMTYESSGSERLNSKGCVGCHDTWNDTKAIQAVDGVRAVFEARLDALADMLIARGFLNTNKETVATGANAARTADDRGALYNYLALVADKSGGVHNPVYADAVLTATIDYLTAAMLANK